MSRMTSAGPTSPMPSFSSFTSNTISSISSAGSSPCPSPVPSPNNCVAIYCEPTAVSSDNTPKVRASWNKKESNAFKAYFFRKSKTNPDEVICKIATCTSKDRGLKGCRFSNLKRHIVSRHQEEFRRYTRDLELAQVEEVMMQTQTPDNKANVKFRTTEKEFMKDLVDLCTVHGVPLATIDYTAFQHLIKPYLDSLSITVNSQTVKEAIYSRARLLKDGFKRDFAGKFVALKVDCATRLLIPHMGIHVRFIHQDQIKVRLLRCMPILQSHTEDTIKSEIIATLDDYNIPLVRVISATSDSDTNMFNEESVNMLLTGKEDLLFIKDEEIVFCKVEEGGIVATDNAGAVVNDAVEALLIDDISPLRCAAQSLHIAINDALKKEAFGTEIGKVRRLFSKIRNETVTSSIQNWCEKMPILEMKTGWNSTYAMLSSVYELQGLIQEHAPEEFQEMTEADFGKIKDICDCLQPCVTASVSLRNDEMPFSEVYGIFWKLSQGLKRNSTIFSKILAREIEGVKLLVLTPELFAAVLLDPRYMKLLDTDQIISGKTRLHEAWGKILACTDEERSEDTVVHQELPEDMELDDADDLDMLAAIIENEQSNKSLFQSTERPTPEDISVKLNTFIRGPRLGLREDVFEYWSNSRMKHPQLYELAQIFLTIPATQKSVEHLSSKLQSIKSNHGFNLRDEILQDTLLIQLQEGT